MSIQFVNKELLLIHKEKQAKLIKESGLRKTGYTSVYSKRSDIQCLPGCVCNF